MRASVAELDRARRDPAVFAEMLIGQPLWPHQVEVVRSPARYRVLCAGRRSGKTRVFGVLSLWQAFAVPRSKVMIVSASDTSAKRMFSDVSGMALAAPALRGSVADDTTHLLTLSNGSTIECVPASMKAVRSAEADLLIVDEAGFVDQTIWESAEPVVGARAGSRVLLASTPWRGPGHFFHDLWQAGMSRTDPEVAAWHWPSTVSPLVDRRWLEGVKSRSSPTYFAREYLAEWTAAVGLLLTPEELMGAVLDYELVRPGDAHEHGRSWTSGFDGRSEWLVPETVAGVDWGMAVDAHAFVVLAALDDAKLNVREELRGAESEGDLVFWLPWLEVHHRMPYHEFTSRVVKAAGGYNLRYIASETNGVGAAATESLGLALTRAYEQGKLAAPHNTTVMPVWTDNRRKQSGFGLLKAMLQSRRLVLPRHPELLKQLAALEVSELPSGSVAIAVPDRVGHDDLAMALMQALSCIQTPARWWDAHKPRPSNVEIVETANGVKVPLPLRMLQTGNPHVFGAPPRGAETETPW